MKNILMTTAAIMAFAMPAAALDLKRTNVPAMSGSVPGFYIEGAGFFVGEGYEGRATVASTVVPASVDVKDLGEVTAWLTAQGFTDLEPQIQTSRMKTIDGESVRVDIPAYRQSW